MINDIHQSTGHGIRQICASLQGPRSPSAMSGLDLSSPKVSGPNGSFYHAAAPTPTQSEDRRIGDLIETLFQHQRRRSG